MRKRKIHIYVDVRSTPHVGIAIHVHKGWPWEASISPPSRVSESVRRLQYRISSSALRARTWGFDNQREENERYDSMPLDTIKQVLMKRDGMTADEADELIAEAKADLQKRLEEGEMPEDICEEWFGLEPDYIMELL